MVRAWAGLTVALVVVLGGTVACTAEEPPPPTPTSSPHAVTAAPTGNIVVGPTWWRDALPVDGELVSLAARTSGHVRVERHGSTSIRITFSGFRVDSDAAFDLRVQLAGGDVAHRGDGPAEYVPSGDPVEVGTLPSGATAATIDVRTPQILPRTVHSLIVLDYTTDTRLAAAELIPAR